MSTTTASVHVIGPNLSTEGEPFHVHAEGCSDVYRSRLYSGPEFATDRTTTYEFTGLRELVAAMYSDLMTDDPSVDEDEYVTASLADFRVFPCVSALHPNFIKE